LPHTHHKQRSPSKKRPAQLSAALNHAFSLLYTRFASAYDIVDWLASAGLWWDWQKSVLPTQLEGQILELGCGTGHLLADMLARGYSAAGMDRSSRMCTITATRLQKRSLSQPVVNADVRRLPFPSDSFDLLLATFPPPALLEAESAEEYHRLLKPGGRLRITLGVALDSGFRGWTPVYIFQRLLVLLYSCLGRKSHQHDVQSLYSPAFIQSGLETEIQVVRRKYAELIVLNCRKPRGKPHLPGANRSQ